MTNRNYVAGVTFERNVIKWLQSQGFVAARTAGSHGQMDIWAVSKYIIRLIQCKTTQKAPTVKLYLEDLRSISKVECPENCSKELWVRYKRKTEKILIL